LPALSRQTISGIPTRSSEHEAASEKLASRPRNWFMAVITWPTWLWNRDWIEASLPQISCSECRFHGWSLLIEYPRTVVPRAVCILVSLTCFSNESQLPNRPRKTSSCHASLWVDVTPVRKSGNLASTRLLEGEPNLPEQTLWHRHRVFRKFFVNAEGN
jgi:hypothetical protein